MTTEGTRVVQPGPTDFTPLYVHISRYLRGRILDGELRMGDVIPSESELVTMFGTTRGTVRAAVDVLVGEGLVRRAHGKGTFVQLRPIRHNIWNFGGFTDSLRGRSETAVAKVVSTRPVDLEGGRSMNSCVCAVSPASAALSICHWIRHGFPLDIFPGIDVVDFENRSLYEYFRTIGGRSPRRTNMTLAAGVPDDRTRGLLGEADEAGALLGAEGSAFDEQEVEIERIAIVYSSRIHFNLTTSISEPGERIER